MIGQRPGDPLLGSTPTSYPTLPELEEEQRKIAERMDLLKKQQIQRQQPSSPIWDEIDSIVAGMSDQEMVMINQNKDFVESTQIIQGILQREYLRIMRPIVEQTKDGKEALENHLSLIKKLRKIAKDEVNKKYSMLEEYMGKYSNIPFSEFMEMKKNEKK